MLSDYICPGNRIELQGVTVNPETGEEEKKIYVSEVYDLITDERIDLMMPLAKGQLRLLPVDARYQIVFYGKRGLYECDGIISDRYRSNNIFILTMDLLSPLKKLQRREYYRFTCVIDMKIRQLRDNERKLLQANRYFPINKTEPMDDATIVDISGGGMRMISKIRYDENVWAYVTFELPNGSSPQKFQMFTRMLRVSELENRPGFFEHRMQFIIIDEERREDIIHYIFEEERRMMRRR